MTLNEIAQYTHDAVLMTSSNVIENALTDVVDCYHYNCGVDKLNYSPLEDLADNCQNTLSQVHPGEMTIKQIKG